MYKADIGENRFSVNPPSLTRRGFLKLAGITAGLLAAGCQPCWLEATEPTSISKTTDAVATAAMGFDPLASPPTPPFIRSDNYMTMAVQSGLGSNDLRGVEVIGASIDDVEFQFEPAWEM